MKRQKGRIDAQAPVRPTIRVLCIILLGCVLGLDARAADRVEVRAGVHRGYGRLVFEWSEPTGFETKIASGTLTVRFDRPFEAEFDGPLETLSAYLTGAEMDENGTAVIFSLKDDGLSLRSSQYGTSVVLDLILPTSDTTSNLTSEPISEPISDPVPDPVPDPVSDSASASALNQRPGVRIGEHNKFTRTVFDWPFKVNYQVDRKDRRVVVTFGREDGGLSAPDLSRFQENPPRFIESAVAKVTEHNLVVTFRVGSDTGLRHFADGDKVVIDVQEGKVTKAVARGLSIIKPAARTAQPPVVILTVPDTLLPEDAYKLKLEVSSLPVGVRLVFPWENPIPAAIFQRAGYMWVVFDQPSRADFSALTANYSDRVITAEQLSNQHATLLRFKIPDGSFISSTRNDLDWVVDITETPTPPTNPLTIERELDVHGGARIFVPALDTGNRWDLRDPEVGDILAVVPIQAPGHGMAQDRLFAEFHFLMSAQGVIVQPLSEWVNVEPRRNGVRIIGENGLILTKGRLPERLGVEFEVKKNPLLNHTMKSIQRDK